MEAIDRINWVINYIEENLHDKEVCYSEISKITLMPISAFQRFFSLTTGLTLSEYIRRRRLSLSANDILNTDDKIIDIAVKYGYDSADAFSVAFKRAYNVSPSVARQNQIKIEPFYRLNYSLSINYVKGDENMNDLNYEKGKYKPQIEAMENASPRRTVNVDLSTMKSLELHPMDVQYENSMMVMHADGHDCGMLTAETFTVPLKVELRAKTDSSNIRMRYNQVEVILNWECNYDAIQVDDMSDVTQENPWSVIEYGNGYNGRIPENEFVDIEWIIGTEIMLVKVNGDLRYVSDDVNLIKRVNGNSDSVRVNPAWGSTVTVESLRVTEL